MSQDSLPHLSPEAKSIVIGSLYEHYKGLRYKILGIARHSETLEELIVYQALYGEGDMWARPLNMFLENVTIEGKSQPRFVTAVPVKKNLPRKLGDFSEIFSQRLTFCA